MPRKKKPKSTRLTKSQLDLYGTNLRKLLHQYPVIKKRLAYLCSFLFDGDDHAMAAALGVCYRQLRAILIERSRLTVAVAAQIVARLGVRSEWLLCGTGDVFVKDSSAESLILPKTIESSFQVFDAINNFAGLPEFLPPIPPATETQMELAPFIETAKAVYQARVAQRSVGLFLGSDAFLAAQATVILPFFRAQYANILVTTAEYAQYDLHRALRTQPDLNSIALLAANRGIGYGEAIGLFALPADAPRESSLLVSLYDSGVPTMISAEIGELCAHAAGPVRGAESAAAVGAAAYVDLLIFTEQLRNFIGDPPGVFIIAGEPRRGVRFFLQRLEALKVSEPQQNGFTLIVFSPVDGSLQTYITKHGGRVLFLGNPTTFTLMQLLQTCDDVYAGKIT